MFVDNSLVVSGAISGNTITGQTVTGTNVVVISTNVIDLSQARDIGAGELIQLNVQVVTAGAGADSITIQAITAAGSGLVGQANVIGSSGDIPSALLTKGSRFVINLSPFVGGTGQRYLGVRYRIVGTSTAGAYFAHFGIGAQDGPKYYPSGIAI